MATAQEIQNLLRTVQVASKAKKAADDAYNLAFANKQSADAAKKDAQDALLAALESSANL